MLILYYGIDRFITVPIQNLVKSIKNISTTGNLPENFDMNFSSKEVNIIAKEISGLLKTIKGLLMDIEEKISYLKQLQKTHLSEYTYFQKNLSM
ncbi:MAG: hypothetical protein Q9M89_06470 [Persephonella sp.]|nr:hypothetical protein [Persephonella sp.]